ncbi:ArsR family transcriptional regulator [Actinoplanes sp. ATCC 53533]|nr:ArsR family transcriptional regulator [Actinoplanes sp. ATCC 53533]
MRSRLAILRRLAGRGLRLADLTGIAGFAQSTVSAHLACLRDCGLVVGGPKARPAHRTHPTRPFAGAHIGAVLLGSSGPAASPRPRRTTCER